MFFVLKTKMKKAPSFFNNARAFIKYA